MKNENTFEATQAIIPTIKIVKYKLMDFVHCQFKIISNDFLKPTKIINQ
ncbi:MAG TPA: hypothetical protein P5052_05000 [Candidatus Paceibacterota bacterium]|nr:hypothetical protein [Candidatus Paceibacterota bacterium]